MSLLLSDLAKDTVFTDYMPGWEGVRENKVLKRNAPTNLKTDLCTGFV